MATSAVSVGTSATSLVAENFERIYLTINNQSAVEVFLGDVSNVTTSSGIGLAAGAQLTFKYDGSIPQFFFQGQLWGVVTSSTADVRVMELVRTR